MAFVPKLTISQSSDCSKFTIKEESNYGDTYVTTDIDTAVCVVKYSDGSTLATIDMNDAIINNSGEADVTVTKDSALLFEYTIVFDNAMGSPITPVEVNYITYAALVCNTNACLFNRMYNMSVNKRLEYNLDYIRDTIRVKLEKDNATYASSFGDIFLSQESINRAKKICDGENII